jgi:hypothetical protein
MWAHDVGLWAYVSLDDVIVSVDLQDVARVTGDGAASSVEEAQTAALELCIADQRILAVDGLTRVMDTARGTHTFTTEENWYPYNNAHSSYTYTACKGVYRTQLEEGRKYKIRKTCIRISITVWLQTQPDTAHLNSHAQWMDNAYSTTQSTHTHTNTLCHAAFT